MFKQNELLYNYMNELIYIYIKKTNCRYYCHLWSRPRTFQTTHVYSKHLHAQHNLQTADTVATYGQGRELFRQPTYIQNTFRHNTIYKRPILLPSMVKAENFSDNPHIFKTPSCTTQFTNGQYCCHLWSRPRTFQTTHVYSKHLHAQHNLQTADIVAIYGRGRELFRPPTYIQNTFMHNTVYKLPILLPSMVEAENFSDHPHIFKTPSRTTQFTNCRYCCHLWSRPRTFHTTHVHSKHFHAPHSLQIADIVVTYGRGRELFRPPTYIQNTFMHNTIYKPSGY